MTRSDSGEPDLDARLVPDPAAGRARLLPPGLRVAGANAWLAHGCSLVMFGMFWVVMLNDRHERKTSDGEAVIGLAVIVGVVLAIIGAFKRAAAARAAGSLLVLDWQLAEAALAPAAARDHVVVRTSALRARVRCELLISLALPCLAFLRMGWLERARGGVVLILISALMLALIASSLITTIRRWRGEPRLILRRDGLRIQDGARTRLYGWGMIDSPFQAARMNAKTGEAEPGNVFVSFRLVPGVIVDGDSPQLAARPRRAIEDWYAVRPETLARVLNSWRDTATGAGLNQVRS